MRLLLKRAFDCARGLALFLALTSGAAEAAPEISGVPFAARTFAPAKTMFVTLAPEATGVRTENRYADPRMWSDLYQEFLFGAIGTGVAIGDYDGDGRPDIFVVSKTESCRLFRNLGDWKFADVTEQAGVLDQGDAVAIWKQGVTFVDVNNDGRLDIYVCRFDAPNLLYINQGNGTFKEEAHAYGLDVKDASGMAAFCDYDRDGWLDVYIATNLLDTAKHPNGQRGYLFHNNRNGTFSNVTVRAGLGGESQSHSATWWDYDDDGWPDLYVANDYGVADFLYHNNHDGTFTDTLERVAPHTSFSSMGSDLGDVNNDGLIDFFVADMSPTTHEKDQRSVADTRAKLVDPPDGSTRAQKYHRNALLLNTGTGRCLEAAFLTGLAATDWTWSVRLEDLDNDGRLDLFVTNGMFVEQNVDVNMRMMAAESTAERVRIMRDSPKLLERHLAFRNLGDLEFENAGAAWGLDQKGISFGSAFGDLGNTGNLDVVYSNYHDTASVLRNQNATGHRLIVQLRGTVSNRFGIGATVKIESSLGVQVRPVWLARGYMTSSEPIAHFGLGPDITVNRLTVSWPSGHVQTFENLAADFRYTITEPSTAIPIPDALSKPRGQFEDVSKVTGLEQASHEESLDEVSSERLVPARFSRRGPALAVGALAAGGRDDIVVGGTTRDRLRLFVPSDGRYIGATPLPAGTVPADDGPVLLFDVDGDGLNDLLVTRGGDTLPPEAAEYQPQLYINNGQGSFRPAQNGALPDLPINVGAVAAADFNRDGKLDLFIGARLIPRDYPRSPRSALLVNRGGKFEDVTDTVAPGLREVGLVTSALWTDVDGDGWLDLLLTTDWGHVKYFHNNAGKAFEDWSDRAGFTAAGTGWWTSLAAADFNGDGRPDYVVGNVGLNTQYQASPAHPALLFYGDFAGHGASQTVEAYYEGDKLYPWRTRKDLGATIPDILTRFPRNNVYAHATLGEIIGDKKLAASERFAATELRSGVFLSQADGTFRFEPLPRLAQIAPLQGIVAGDFDGDGHADIYAVQNSYAPNPVVGRFDGGLSQLLRGDGQGHFTPVAPIDSQLIVPGDAKALAILDLDEDGWPDFLVTRNNSTSLAFRNRGVPGHRSFRVVLSGSKGNPSAIGARVTVELSDSSTQTSEVYAGAGYYSQSTAACFFGYNNTTSVTKIRVRWPSGVTTEHETPSVSSTTVRLTQPAS